MKIHFNKKTIILKAKKLSFWGKFSGLMFKSRNTSNLLFNFSAWEASTIHSFFVFFPFLAIWMDEKNNVLEWSLVKPFTLAVTPKTKPSQLIEIPLNKNNKKIIEIFVDKKETFKYNRG
ncbi:MAG: DUF192 domain-containing protein [Nanoarchaeota archaeon]|nr:DUF192 domain-containing protein [Nanoarchaeota archaeon]MBU0976902.1 DUF192 domain-containing protein [Nanoarchaeota archaeon]